MAYSDNFPTQRAVFTLDASNAGRLDPRCSFSRSTTGSFYGKDKHLSSENLLLQSSDFDASWTLTGINGTPTGGQTDPSGGTDGFTIVEASGGTYHRLHQTTSPTGDLALTVYAKQNAGTRYLCLTFYYNSPSTQNFESAVFDLAGGAAATLSGASSSFTSVTTSQTASGNGYYKCTLKATGTITNANISLHNSSTTTGLSSNNGLPTYSGDNSSSLDIAFALLTSNGATDYQPTTTQIHREYAPTLQTAASGAARFEHSATDGQSEGILIEGQSTNLVTYSETLATGWTEGRSTLTAASGIAPDGTLTSNLFTVDGTAANSHNAYFEYASGGATPQTFSIFAKKGSANYIALRYGPTHGTFSDGYVFFDLSNGTKGTVTAAISESSIVDCGNGWYRCSITNTALQSGTARAIIYVAKEDNTFSFDGNSYDHIQVWGAQIEANQSFSSSYLKSNSGSTTTRAADSLTVTDASIFTGGEHSVYWEGSFNGSITDPRMFAMSDGTSDNRFVVDFDDGNVPRIRNWADGTSYMNRYATGQTLPDGFSKIVGTLKTDESRLAINGTQYAVDTTNIVVGTMDRLGIGTGYNNNNIADGHVKRVAYYNTALSQTEIETLTAS